MSNSLLAFKVLLECLRQRDWATAKALVPAAIGKETIDMCMCRVSKEGFPPSTRLPYVLRVISELTDLGQLSAIGRAANDRWLRLCSGDEHSWYLGAVPGDKHPTAAEVNQLRQVYRELEQQLDAAQALLLTYRRPPQLVERLMEAVAAWKADPRRGHTADSYLCAAHQALEDADIFRAGKTEPPLCEEPEDEPPPICKCYSTDDTCEVCEEWRLKAIAVGDGYGVMTPIFKERQLQELREIHGKTDAEVIALAEANQWPLEPGADHHVWLILLGRGDLIPDNDRARRC